MLANKRLQLTPNSSVQSVVVQSGGGRPCLSVGGQRCWAQLNREPLDSEKMLRGGIDHLDLTVTDPASSETFYRAVLGYMGFEPVRLAHGATHLRIFQAADAGQRVFSVALQPAKHAGNHDRYIPGLHHVAFRASSRDDVDGLYQVLRDLGAEVLDPPAEYPHYAPGYYAVFFADPDGLKLEFVHMPTQPELAV